MNESHLSPLIFLSYAHADREIVAHVRADLQAEGVALWIDKEGIPAGNPDWEEALRKAMHEADAVLLVASPNARVSRYVKDELRIAEMYQRPVYPLWVVGERWMDVVPIGWGGTQYIDARAEEYQQAIHELVGVLGTLQRAPGLQGPPPEQVPVPHGPPRNPYKGLRAFRPEDARDFFGRSRLIAALVDAVRERLASEQQGTSTARLVTVIGPSGSGKSSVVLAGLLPKLQQGALPGSQEWVYVEPMVPGQHPIEALTLALSSCFPARSLKAIREDLEDDSARGLHLLMASLTKRVEKHVVLLIDQFEEVFTQTTSEDERRRFLDLVVTAATEPRGPLLVLLTLRADFYDRPMQYPEVGQQIAAHHLVVFPLEMQDLRAVIEQPARLPEVGLTFEGDLVGDLLFEVQGQVGALPLLQFTLDQLFQRRNERQLTLSAYQEIGGVKGALAKHAEATYASLPSEDYQSVARALFLRLIDPGTLEQEATRRRTALSELVFPNPKETTTMREVMTSFTEARLLTTATVAGVPTVEVSHEALIREWRRLGDWLLEVREDLRLQKAIGEDATEWRRRGKPVDRLYRGTQLIEAEAWQARNRPNVDEEAFLLASVAEREREAAVEQERRAQEEQQRRRYTRRTVLVGLGGLGLTAITLTVIGVLLRRPPSVVVKRQVVTPPKSLPYSYLGHSGSVNSVSWSPDGKRLASAGDDKTVQVWDASTGSSLLTYKGHNSYVFSVAWSPDGKRLASASYDGTVQVWDASTGSLLLTYTGHSYSVYTVAWSPDGKRLASAGYDGTVQVWDASTSSPLFTYKGHSDRVHSVAWSPDGKRLASAGDDKTVQVWDASTSSPLLTYTGHSDSVLSVAWSPDGKRLASASDDGTVQVWDASTGSLLLTYTGHVNFVSSVAWSPDGKRLASASGDGTVQVWDASTSSSLFTYKGQSFGVLSVAWSPDGKRLASASGDGTVQVWNASTGSPLLTYTGQSFGVLSAAWSPDGKRLASAGDDKTVQVWNASTGSPLLTYRGHSSYVNSVAWSPDGKRLASASGDGTVQVWDASTGSPLFTYKGHSDRVESVAWSPDGKRLASASADGTVQVWDASNGSPLFTYKGHSYGVLSVAWSPDGKRLASASDDRTVQVWNASNGSPLFTYRGHSSSVNSVAWSPDGNRLASASVDRTVQVWLML